MTGSVGVSDSSRVPNGLCQSLLDRSLAEYPDHTYKMSREKETTTLVESIATEFSADI